MKITTVTATALSTIIAISSTLTHADTTQKMSKKEMIASGKGAALFTTGAVAGLIAGGPIGAIIGAVGGAYIGEDLKKGARTDIALASAEADLVDSKIQLTNTEAQVTQLKQATAERLEFQVLFATGEDDLSHQDLQRLNSLAIYLKKNPELKIRLDGYADPRGTDEYNELLSQERALTVINALEARGINKGRVSYNAHGAKLSTAYQGDLEAYALERRVKIEVYASQDAFAAN